MRDAVDFDRFPSPASSHSDSTSRIDSPRTKAPITNAFNGSVRSNFVARGNSLEHERRCRLPDLRDLDRQLPLPVCTVLARNPLREPVGASGRRS